MRRAGSLVTLTTAGLMGLGYLGSPVSAAYGDNTVYSEATGAGPTADEGSSVAVVANTTAAVHNYNQAVANSHDCTGCRAVAVAFQVVLVPGQPADVQPVNEAVAYNVSCLKCVSVAIAKQYLLYSHGATSIDQDAQREVARIRAQVDSVARSGVDPATMASQLEPLYNRLIQVVRDGLQDAGNGRSSERAREA